MQGPVEAEAGVGGVAAGVAPVVSKVAPSRALSTPSKRRSLNRYPFSFFFSFLFPPFPLLPSAVLSTGILMCVGGGGMCAQTQNIEEIMDEPAVGGVDVTFESSVCVCEGTHTHTHGMRLFTPSPMERARLR